MRNKSQRVINRLENVRSYIGRILNHPVVERLPSDKKNKILELGNHVKSIIDDFRDKRPKNRKINFVKYKNDDYGEALFRMWVAGRRYQKINLYLIDYYKRNERKKNTKLETASKIRY